MATRENPARIMLDRLIARRSELVVKKDELDGALARLSYVAAERNQLIEDINSINDEITSFRAARGL
jgi:hypothetical protein